MKALALAALLLLTPAAAIAQDENPAGLTCESAQTDFKTAVTRYNKLVDEFKATDDQHQKAIIFLEGQPLKELAKYLADWYKVNCKDI